MAAVINTNISSLNSQRNLTTSQSSLATSLQRLSSGLRINSAKDDAAGLAISERFTSQIKGLTQAARNANDGISLAQTAEGALGQVGDALQRIRELSVQSANATNSSSDRAALQQEVSQLMSEITRIGDTTSFNGLKILDGSYSNQQYQIGANAGETINVSVADSRASQLGATTLTSTAGFASKTVLTSATPPTVTQTALTGGTNVNGFAIATTGATTVSAVIDAINLKSADTGVTASRATNNSTVGAGAADPLVAAQTLKVNGTSINLAAGSTLAARATAINNVAVQTGVTAEVSGTQLKFTSGNGADFTLEATAAEVGVGAANTATTFSAGITLSAKLGSSINVVSTTGTLGELFEVPAATASVDLRVSTMDISTVKGANAALAAADAALTQVSSTRATLGAIQNRFTAVVTNLNSASENFSASRSRILDTDFAAETANLTRGQILQQAGTAMLAQANSLPNGVLALLRG